MHKKMIILLIGLFFPLILQSDNTFSFGQVDAQENPNLNGIWEKIDEYPNQSLVHINQEGNSITAAYEPTGLCYDDMFNPTPETLYAETKLDFSGELTGNIIQGKLGLCVPDERTIKSYDLRLTVSDDRKTLNGYVVTNGQQKPEQYVFVTSLVDEPSIKVSTDKPNYSIGDTVGISGGVSNMGQESEVLIQVDNPVGDQIFSRFVPVTSDGSFKTNFDFKNIAINGTYTAFAIYPNATGKPSVSFGYGLPTKGVSTEDIAIASGAIAAVGVGGILLYKHGYFKRIEQLIKSSSQNVEAPEIPVIYVAIECGLENPELSGKQSFSRNGIETQDMVKLEQGFSKAVDDILKNRKAIKNVKKDIDFIKWCKEAKENPNKILSKVSDDIINKFLSSISPYFGNLILSELSVESEVSATRDRHKSIKKSVQFNLVPIEPFIEFVLYVNTQRVSSAKFIFTIETNVEVKNLGVNMARTETSIEEELQERPKQNYDKKISIEHLIFAIAVEFSRLKIGPVEKNLSPPVIIGRKKVEVKKFGSSHR